MDNSLPKTTIIPLKKEVFDGVQQEPVDGVTSNGTGNRSMSNAASRGSGDIVDGMERLNVHERNGMDGGAAVARKRDHSVLNSVYAKPCCDLDGLSFPCKLTLN